MNYNDETKWGVYIELAGCPRPDRSDARPHHPQWIFLCLLLHSLAPTQVTHTASSASQRAQQAGAAAWVGWEGTRHWSSSHIGMMAGDRSRNRTEIDRGNGTDVRGARV